GGGYAAVGNAVYGGGSRGRKRVRTQQPEPGNGKLPARIRLHQRAQLRQRDLAAGQLGKPQRVYHRRLRDSFHWRKQRRHALRQHAAQLHHRAAAEERGSHFRQDVQNHRGSESALPHGFLQPVQSSVVRQSLGGGGWTGGRLSTDHLGDRHTAADSVFAEVFVLRGCGSTVLNKLRGAQ